MSPATAAQINQGWLGLLQSRLQNKIAWTYVLPAPHTQIVWTKVSVVAVNSA